LRSGPAFQKGKPLFPSFPVALPSPLIFLRWRFSLDLRKRFSDFVGHASNFCLIPPPPLSGDELRLPNRPFLRSKFLSHAPLTPFQVNFSFDAAASFVQEKVPFFSPQTSPTCSKRSPFKRLHGWSERESAPLSQFPLVGPALNVST